VAPYSAQHFDGEYLLKTESEQIEVIETVSIGEAAAEQGSRLSALARDVATMSGGTALAAVFNTLLVFLIPRLVSVEDFGYWRLFLLYAGFVGFLHLGFADGALLRWAGRPLEEIRPEVTPSLKFIFWLHLTLIVPGAPLAALLLPRPLNLVGVAVLVYSVIFNSATVLQFSLQGARVFRPVAIAAAAPVGGFVVMAFLWNLRGTPNFQGLIALYCIAWAGVLVYLWIRVRPGWGNGTRDSVWSLGKTCFAMGWPIVLANGGFGFVQSADRLMVSSVLPIREFAQYSLAASTMFVPVAAILAISRVFFSHVAAVEHEGRARVYAHASRFVLLAWSLLLPYYFFLEAFVRVFLPKYVPALPVAAILLLGVVFLAGIQILHMSYSYLYGRQRQFLLLTVGASAMSFAVAIVMAVWLRSLVAVATGQVVALALWWAVNEWSLRETTGQGWKEWLQAFGLISWSAGSFGVATRWTNHIGWQLSIYYALVIFALIYGCGEEFRLGGRLFRSSYASSAG
jgi:O-antigen/teichoic acid export membrane protein